MPYSNVHIKICLASCDTDKPPTSVRERTALANAGLGDAAVTFNLDGDSIHFHEQLLQKFPKLSSTGYELMLYDRASENSSFCILKSPYLPRKLKEVVGQCKIYVKPLQQDLLNSDDDRCTACVPLIHIQSVVPVSTILFFPSFHHFAHSQRNENIIGKCINMNSKLNVCMSFCRITGRRQHQNLGNHDVCVRGNH